MSPLPPQSPSPQSQSPPQSERAFGPDFSASEFLEDPGPAFDPDQAPEAPELEEEGEVLRAEDGWKEDTIKDLLLTQGNVTNYLLRLGDDDDTWKQTEEDLRAISRPLTRILNRYDATRAAAAAGDEIALGAAITAYGTRNYARRRRILAAIAAQEPAPITGVPADEGVGPLVDEEYQRVNEAPPALRPKGVR